jgi:phasin family protein
VTTEEIMTDTTSYFEMLRKFSSDLGLPKLNLAELLQAQKENIDAPSQSAKVAAQGAQSVAQKQREVLEAGLREAATLAREFERLGKVHENCELQTEFAKKVIVVQGAQASASTGRQSTADAVKITQDRMKERVEEVRASVSKQISLTSPRVGEGTAEAGCPVGRPWSRGRREPRSSRPPSRAWVSARFAAA